MEATTSRHALTCQTAEHAMEAYGCLSCGGKTQLQAPLYEYTSLDLEKEEQRFLILQPCPGDKAAFENHVRCSFEVRPMASAGEYIAVRNTRGYRRIPNTIDVEGKVIVVSSALEVFLRHFRRHDVPVTLWMRHICLQEFVPSEERSRYWTREHVDSMYARATKVVDMPDLVTDVIERGLARNLVAGAFKRWQKTWDGSLPSDFSFTLPSVIPIKLGVKPDPQNPSVDYIYVPLDMRVNEIRVLLIEPSEDRNAPVSIRLAHCPIICEAVYSALSYTWGTGKPIIDIIATGQRMKIRENLHQALKALRMKEKVVAIWVDAVCINQDDVAERNRQIKRMVEIYHRAVRVFCYLGEQDGTSDMALEFAQELDESHSRMQAEGEDGSSMPFRSPDVPERCAALFRFLCRPYFRRIWVIQEIAVSSDPIIYVGNQRMTSFETLDWAAFFLQGIIAMGTNLAAQMTKTDPELKASGVPYDQLSFIRKLFYFRHLFESLEGSSDVDFIQNKSGISKQTMGYLEAAILTRDFQATDGRDKIFALWNLAMDTDGLEFELSYSKSLERTFQDFAVSWAEQHGSLDVIAASDPFSGSDQFYKAAPSWCPDWSVPSATSCLVRRERMPMKDMDHMDELGGVLYSADGGISQLRASGRLFRFDGNVLECRGVIVDAISVHFQLKLPQCLGPDCQSFHPPWERPFFQAKGWCDIVSDSGEWEANGVYEDPLLAAVAMFHGDVPSAWRRREMPDQEQTAVHSSGNKKRIAFMEYECITDRSRHVSTSPSVFEQAPYYDIIKTTVKGRTLCKTQRGYMALAPSNIKDDGVDENWVLAILATCSVPVILQEVESDTGGLMYRALGTCFVQGWMEGELLKEMSPTEAPADFWFTESARNLRLKIV